MEQVKKTVEFITRNNMGILSTLSAEIKGFPFGSLTPYAVDSDFNLILHFSQLAQHAKNVKEDNRCSLTIFENTKNDIVANSRLCYLGTLDFYPKQEEAEYLYNLQVGQNHSLSAQHGFTYMRLKFEAAYFILGFGQMFWIKKDAWNLKNLFSYQESKEIIEHAMKDHLDFLQKIYQTHENVEFKHIDQWGIVLSKNKENKRFLFNQTLEDKSKLLPYLKELINKNC